MGTRGYFGFYYKGKYYLIYNHFDSYFSGLGVNLINEILKAIENGELENWKTKLDNIVEVKEGYPISGDTEKLNKYSDFTVSSKSRTDWYCLLRKCQGSFEKVLDSGYVLNEGSKEKLTGDIFIEYSYVLDFDNDLLSFTHQMDFLQDVNCQKVICKIC